MENGEVTTAPKTPLEIKFQEYLQACCEAGQLEHALYQLDTQRKEIEKQLDVAQQKVRRAAKEHASMKQDLTAQMNQGQSVPAPSPEVGAH